MAKAPRDYGIHNRWLGQMKAITDTLMDFRNEDEDQEHAEAEVARLIEELRIVTMPTEWRDLTNSIIELALDELD